MISDTHRRVREATEAHHQRLETRLDIFSRIDSRQGRRALVERFAAFHAAAEAALEPWVGDLPGLDFEARRRSGQLARDLVALGGGRRAHGAPIRLAGAGQALGLMYVLEGSTLGGRVIRKRVAAAGGDMEGLGFLDPYGEAVGERWRAFLALVDAEPDVEGVMAGAVAGFAHAERELCGTAVHG